MAQRPRLSIDVSPEVNAQLEAIAIDLSYSHKMKLGIKQIVLLALGNTYGVEYPKLNQMLSDEMNRPDKPQLRLPEVLAEINKRARQ